MLLFNYILVFQAEIVYFYLLLRDQCLVYILGYTFLFMNHNYCVTSTKIIS